MALVSIIEAGRLTGKSVPTIYRHIKTGKLSQTSEKLIDTSELIRVYGALNPIDNHRNDSQKLSNDNHDSQLLQLKSELLEMQLQQSIETVRDLRERLDKSEAERRQLMQMLTHQPEPTAPAQNVTESKLLLKLFGKKPVG